MMGSLGVSDAFRMKRGEDYWKDGGHFTHYTQSQFHIKVRKQRLDYFFVSNARERLVEWCEVRDGVGESDHRPLEMKLSMKRNFGDLLKEVRRVCKKQNVNDRSDTVIALAREGLKGCKELRKVSPEVKVRIGEREKDMLCDTGAWCSLIKSSVFHELFPDTVRRPQTSVLRLADDTRFRPDFEADIEVRVQNKVMKFTVKLVENLPVDLLMGWEDMERLNFVIHCGKGFLKWNGVCMNFKWKNHDKILAVTRVRTKEVVVLEPGITCQDVSIRVPKRDAVASRMIIGLVRQSREDSLGCRVPLEGAVVKMEKGVAKIALTNFTHKRIRIPKGTVVGEFTPFMGGESEDNRQIPVAAVIRPNKETIERVARKIRGHLTAEQLKVLPEEITRAKILAAGGLPTAFAALE
jgi:hypothetical protein